MKHVEEEVDKIKFLRCSLLDFDGIIDEGQHNIVLNNSLSNSL